MKAIIVAGGTGGHFYPGLTVAKELLKENDDVSFIVKKDDYVISLLKHEGIRFSEIFASGFERKFSFGFLKTVFLLFVGFFQSVFLLLRERPDVLVAMGGYVSVPPALASRLIGIKVFLHEQNMRPGLANRFLGRLAEKVAVSFLESQKFFPGNSFLTGNPIRPDFKSPPSVMMARQAFGLEPNDLTFLVFGGSLGAHRLNEIMAEAFQRLKKKEFAFQIVHFTGAKDEEWVRTAYSQAKIRSVVSGYSHEMVQAYAAADLLICRSGASTVAEIMVVKKPAIFVPYPFATDNHQLSNARFLEQKGVAKIYEERNLDPFKMKQILQAFLEHPQDLEKMREGFDGIVQNHLDAAKKIVQLVKDKRGV